MKQLLYICDENNNCKRKNAKLSSIAPKKKKNHSQVCDWFNLNYLLMVPKLLAIYILEIFSSGLRISRTNDNDYWLPRQAVDDTEQVMQNYHVEKNHVQLYIIGGIFPFQYNIDHKIYQFLCLGSKV
ncbi:hypothetical protein T12_3177 [Trichinella patagoniensis]|uniref:Uncharacterized protein n=1 Tax=Trichinella patagoniensis TaxID=990121 RepID=A0A0V0ZHF7_9BILA|nr:hypothetical protein T12_3177 [Trichinella patagoniensis]